MGEENPSVFILGERAQLMAHSVVNISSQKTQKNLIPQR